MKIIRKILDLFGLTKFSIICYNEQEWNAIQAELFKSGYYWENHGKNLVYCGYEYPRVLRNHRTGDRFGSKILIMDTYKFMLRSKTKHKFTNCKSFIRKKKLKKLK